MLTVAVVNHKGGVGKTTTAVNFAACLGQKGLKVLLVDLDPQGSATLHLGISDTGERLLAALQSSTQLPVMKTDFQGLSLVPSGYHMSEARKRFSRAIGEGLLERALVQTPKDWDWIVIDCPPALEILTMMGLSACERIIVPVEANFLGISGLEQLLTTLEEGFILKDLREQIMAIVPCRAHPRRKMHNLMLEKLNSLFPGRVAPFIREKCQGSRGSVLWYAGYLL